MLAIPIVVSTLFDVILCSKSYKLCSDKARV
jgi:hypothetical protein